MQGYQSKLSQEFSTMITEINKIEDIEDYRIGVVTTDFNPFNHQGCGNVGDLITASPITPTFNGWIQELKRLKTEEPSAWEEFLKDPTLPSAVNALLEGLFGPNVDTLTEEWIKYSFESGTKAPSIITKQCLDDINKPWLEKGNAQLETKFQCLINVGAYRMPVEKPLRAIADSYVSTCNKGFYRDDAMLVAMILTDHDDTTETADTIYNDYLARRDGMPNQAVILPIIPDANHAPNLSAFAKKFANYHISDISGNYSEVLKTGAKKLETACHNFGNECPTNQCCMPTDWPKLIIGFGAPPIFGIIAGFLLGQGFARKAVLKKQFTDGPTAFGHFLGALLATTSAAITVLCQLYRTKCII